MAVISHIEKPGLIHKHGFYYYKQKNSATYSLSLAHSVDRNGERLYKTTTFGERMWGKKKPSR